MRFELTVVLAIIGLSLSACESMNWKSPADYYAHMKVAPPAGSMVSVCHGYSCKYRAKVKFSKAELAGFGKTLKKAGSEPASERKAIASVIAQIERIAGIAAGTSGDLGQLQAALAGKPGQQDCVDEATNTTSYLIMLEKRGMLKYHNVRQPAGRGFFLDGRWQHFSAVISEKEGGQSYVVDSWPRDNGKLPVILPLDKWMTDYDTYS